MSDFKFLWEIITNCIKESAKTSNEIAIEVNKPLTTIRYCLCYMKKEGIVASKQKQGCYRFKPEWFVVCADKKCKKQPAKHYDTSDIKITEEIFERMQFVCRLLKNNRRAWGLQEIRDKWDGYKVRFRHEIHLLVSAGIIEEEFIDHRTKGYIFIERKEPVVLRVGKDIKWLY